jgi:hypothetical protein
MLTAVEITSKETNQTIDEILNQMQATHQHAKKKLKWYSLEVNQLLFLNLTLNLRQLVHY